MMFEKLSLILRSSSRITLDPLHRKAKLSPLKYGPVKGRFLYFLMALLNAKGIIQMKRLTVSHFRELIEVHPEAIPNIFWPYQCRSWDSSTRVDFLYSHFLTLPDLRYRVECHPSHQRIIADADDIYRGLRIVVDQHSLFMREGMITLNIYVEHERIFTIAFSLCKDDRGKICAIAGAIQGRRMANITELYRDMTKKTYGIRPRDLMVEVFQIVCRLSGVEKIFAVSESHRQHRHHFYQLKNKQSRLNLNYDEVWSDRSGIRCSDAFYELPVIPVRKPLSRIIAKKRSMYRNRYALLERLENEIEQGLSSYGSWVVHEPRFCSSDIRIAGDGWGNLKSPAQ
ncbi:MAG: hypothetical protein DBO99_04370 [gamma proteobacterium symbiont of Ctena orbiculata]|nr:MAG: hypothetical protein DBO99_04370 [gamma proteobacterium symbiont of Ctena orbiculata]